MHTKAGFLLGQPMEGSAAGGHANDLPILPYWPELLFGLLAFAILYVVVSKKVVPALEEVYAQRRAAIEGGMEKAQESQREAAATKAHYEQLLSEARMEANQTREAAREEGAAIVSEMRGAASAEAERIIDQAHRQIEADRQHAMVALRNDVGAMSTDLAGRIVGESLHDETRQKGIVDRFLAELESGALLPVGSSREAGRPQGFGAPSGSGL